jgi:signal recognition particle receptor subunit alpha
LKQLDFSKKSLRSNASDFSVEKRQSSSSMTMSSIASEKKVPMGSWFQSFHNSLKAKLESKVVLQRKDVLSLIENLKINLLSKNIGQEIAEKICESVSVKLANKESLSILNVSTKLRSAVKESLQQLLTPDREIYLLREIEMVRSNKKPYVISLVGVNGVGKSTSLSKLAHWLLQHNLTIMVAACDTFRSGAVEQLRTHCQRLKLHLFDRGYDKDPATVAYEAIKQAGRQGMDIVLIDTAGRMQDNEPLMRSLSKLISLNQPNLVLFVGEALVGNEAVIQLKTFNQRLCDLSVDKSSVIDGIILSKFDTIDDKVGSALSMVYSSGIPILFIGCGQTYADLRTFSAESIIDLLLA